MKTRFLLFFWFVGCVMASSGIIATADIREEFSLPRLRSEFISPPPSCTQVPFWFWNDDITEEGILREIDWMQQHGVYGFLIHARMGLSKEVGYMTDRWLQLVRFAVQEASRRGMMVYLYDEGMYPSGSAHGAVVKDRPDLASQGLRVVSYDLQGPSQHKRAWPMAEHEKPVAAVLVKQLEDGTYQRESAKVLPVADEITADFPEGVWTLFFFNQTPSGGVIRGVHWDEEDSQPNAPRGADLLNPEVAQRFIQFTHEKYYAALQEYFGSTIQGVFTDEPSILARRPKRDLQPWTTDFLATMNRTLGYDFTPFLPFLWVKESSGFETVLRRDYQYAVDQALNKNYYAPLSQWCADHAIALTGHPDGSGDVSPQVYFQQPGQDVVWRWVLPGSTSLEGENSTLGKSASSVAPQLKRPIVINECFGAYGWRLTMEEMKWLADWLFVRGTNRLFLHAFYYSIREQRINERPPDLSWFNLWADHYRQFSEYTNRLSWLSAGSHPVVPIAILTLAAHTPWQAAKVLFQNQIDFNYLDETLLDRVQVKDRKLCIGEARYSALILDGIHFLTADTASWLLSFMEQGVPVIAHDSPLAAHPLRGPREADAIVRIEQNPCYHTAEDAAQLLDRIKRVFSPEVVSWWPCPDLRIAHHIKSGADFYLLTNEGDQPFSARLTFRNQNRIPERWDAETGDMCPCSSVYSSPQGVILDLLSFHPRESRILVFHPDGLPATDARIAANWPENNDLGVNQIDVPSEGWALQIGGQMLEKQTLGSWTENASLRSFSGTGWYSLSLDIPTVLLENGKIATLDLGEVQSFAQVEINGHSCGVRLWPPYRFDIRHAIRAGTNQIRIGVTNTRSNELTKEKLPSGLFGPVKIRITKQDAS